MGASVDNTLVWTLSALPWNVWFLPAPQSLTNNALLISLDTPAWSLMLELLVNFAFVAAWRFLTNCNLMLIIVFSAGALILLTIHFGTVNGGATSGTFALGLARVFYSFPLGVLLCRIFRDRSIVVVRAAALPLIPLIGTGAFLSPPLGVGTLAVSYSLFAVMLISPLLVALGAYVQVRSIIAQGVCVVLGAASYGVYVLHGPMMFPFMRIAKVALGTEFVACENFISVLFAVIMFSIALVLYKFYDLPIRTWLKSFFQRHAGKRLFV